VSITKVVVFFTWNPKKLGSHFYDFLRFSREFTRFSKLDILLKFHFAPRPLERFKTLRTRPWFAENTLELIGGLQFGPWPWEAAAPAKFRRAGRAPGRGNGGARPWAHLGPMGNRCWGGDRTGMGARQKPAAAAAVARLRRRRGLGPNNKWHSRVLKGLWKECARLLDRGKQGGRSSTAAARMPRRRGNGSERREECGAFIGRLDTG
jgi:hypothetical protein